MSDEHVTREARWAAADRAHALRWAARDAERDASFRALDEQHRREFRRLLLLQFVFGLLGAGGAGWVAAVVPMPELTSMALGALGALAGIAVGMTVASMLDRRDKGVHATITDVRVSDLRQGHEWLLEGAWVRVLDVEVQHPDGRVAVTFEQDDERETTREYRGFERAAVR